MLEIFAGGTKTVERESKICANEKCSNEFVPRVYNAIYCSTSCRRIVTNRRILERYHANKEIYSKKRICESRKCKIILSRYNKENICESCKRERFIQRLVGWGWDERKLRDDMSL